MGTHAILSPSGAHRWMPCPGSAVLEANFDDTRSTYAAEGGAAHTLAEWVLSGGETVNARSFLGRVIIVDDLEFEVTEDMADAVNAYADAVRRESAGKMLSVEQSLPIDHLTGEANAHGTADAVAVGEDAIDVHDLKYGMGLRVYAENNSQMLAYASAAMRQHDLVSDFKTVRLFIHQPRLDHVDVWECTPEDIRKFELEAQTAAGKYLEALKAADLNPFLKPGTKQCHFCKAKAVCPALAKHVQEEVGKDFAELNTLASAPSVEGLNAELLAQKLVATDVIESWIKAVRGECERQMLAGKTLPGFKLVEGRRGARAWKDDEAAEALLKSFRLKKDQMYDYKLITPTSAEKVLKEKPKHWGRLLEVITQPKGKVSVAPESDKRPAWTPTNFVADFDAFVPNEPAGGV